MFPYTLFAFATLSVASTLTTRHVLRQAPAGWTAVAPAPKDHLIDMRIGLKQARMDELLATLMQVSDPGHERYGMYLSKAQADELVAPRKETVQLVEEWLSTHGIGVTRRSSSGDWLHATVPVARAERMLNTRYNIYHHTSGSHIVRSESYALPRSLDGHIDVIQPTTYFGKMHERSGTGLEGRASTVLSLPINLDTSEGGCNSTITPDCLMDLYKTKGYTPNSTASNWLGIPGYLEEYANLNDLKLFYEMYRPNATHDKLSIIRVNNGTDNQTKPGTEANLDVQYGGVLTHPIPNTFYSTGGRGPWASDSVTSNNTNEPYSEWVAYMLEQDKLPSTISTSYGDDEQTVPLDYATRVCHSFAQLGVRGVSLLLASGKSHPRVLDFAALTLRAAGDGGVGEPPCLTNSGTPKLRFVPTFPASCPYVTSAGATHRISPERGAGFSQGGFSDYFSRPDYQDKAVETYLRSLGNTYDGQYNKTGRGFPDVSAQGQNYQVVVGGKVQNVFGTSASCPTFAGIITLLNDYRLSNGQPTLGFLNPWLYNNSAMLNDVTSGNNPGCGTLGFEARTGWDPVTGLGTPDFMKMKAAV